MEIEQANRLALEITEKYLNLNVGKHRIQTPYFTNDVGREFGKMLRKGGLPGEEIKRLFLPYNNREIPFGWYRGKGSPEQIEEAVRGIAEMEQSDVSLFTEGGAREFMLLHGLGVDCSGFAYNMYKSVFGEEQVNKMIDWSTPVQEAYKAGAYTFAGKASEIVEAKDMKPLDLLLFKKSDGVNYYHVAVILEDNGWKVVQSTSTVFPMGVHVSDVAVTDAGLDFGFEPARGKSWNQLYSEGRIELRRSKILL
jgi:hypothetical protein